MQKPKGYDSTKALSPGEWYDLDDLKKHLVEELTPSKGGFYVCPLCGSGTGNHKTGALKVYGDEKDYWKCHKCGRSGDIVDLVCFRDNVDSSAATKQLIEKYKPHTASKEDSARKDFQPSTGSEKQEKAPAVSFAGQIAAWHSALAGSAGAAYLRRRGISEETMDRFQLGFATDRNGRPAVVFPYNRQGTFYSMRAIRDDLPQIEKHDMPSSSVAGKEPLFNAAALHQNQPCFVVESQLCAISIMQEGGSAVALCGIGKWKRVIDEKPSAFLILSLDNDEPGITAQANLAEALREKDIPFLEYNVAGDCKDPNELLQKDTEALRGGVAAAIGIAQDIMAKAAEEEQAERGKRTGPGMMDAFLEEVQTHKYEPIPTGIRDIDSALQGGFMRQQLISLGAAPGAGKTALAQWIFEGLAVAGYSCIFLNLEMSRNQILARSISRYAARNGFKITNVKALRGYSWTEDERAAVMEAAEEYKRTVAPFMIYNPDDISADLDGILEYIESEASLAESEGKPAPFVVLDYLQIIQGRKGEDPVELIKRAIISLKKYAVDHNTVVFLIMAHNRESNRTGTITLESGRDTSAIEYSGDTQIGLTFTKCLKTRIPGTNPPQYTKPKNPDELEEDERKEITLKIVKGRFGGTGRRVDLMFDGETMTYTQTYKEFEAVQMKTPFETDDEGWETIS